MSRNEWGIFFTKEDDFDELFKILYNKSNEYIDIFTILNVNKSSNIENCKSINKISLCDMDETKIVLNSEKFMKSY